MNPELVSDAGSIHHQRRWYYVLWSLLLGLSLGCWILWVIPGSRGQATLTLNLTFAGLPQGTKVQVWAGPKDRWQGKAWAAEDAVVNRVVQDGAVSLGPFPLSLAYRRWLKTYIPGRTTDLVVVRLVAENGGVRYLPLSLREDLNTGFLAPKRKLSYGMVLDWTGLTPRADFNEGM